MSIYTNIFTKDKKIETPECYRIFEISYIIHTIEERRDFLDKS
jgi:hypothetical protein